MAEQSARCEWCEQAVDMTVTVAVDLGDTFTPRVDEQWCIACLADLVADEMTGLSPDEA